ncbi:bis(5'-nucleosyl)-tetraphosphatase (symmetrical) YqeK [Clostridium sp. MSJ-11]|uniref:bis(5'-nucleosyl)-tetraphosphatase (symmetrical) n=1 Tax=Clostridium mobile TaxID=2841512 RepID=A0ABS6EFR3_9CLOT|nr:bis(5'-nucleosyl)-tetraphosphatase (symmetrical) YqeK [Clostridium mobile]MBU5483551.1 bis(5'-nucleosyl)-tetraphosphatase (symmetrical) YqeK [Clostridium mobile]
MWNEERIEAFLKENLDNKRYQHSLRVRDTAIDMAKHFGIDENKAAISGLAHDCAKWMNAYELINTVKKNGYKIDEVCEKSPQLLHGLAGAIIARDTMGIKDREIFNAIAYHTTGKKNMTLLEKIIYLADYIEPLRRYAGVEEIRELSYRDIDRAMIKSFDLTIKYIIERGQMLHINTVEGRNYIIKAVGE